MSDDAKKKLREALEEMTSIAEKVARDFDEDGDGIHLEFLLAPERSIVIATDTLKGQPTEVVAL